MTALFHLLVHPVFALLLFPPSSADSSNAIPRDSLFVADTLRRDDSRALPVVLRFAGDCLLAAHYEEAAGEDVSLAFEGFTLLKDADLSCVNLECPVTIRGTKIEKPYNFRMKPRFLTAVQSAGIDVVNIANNHIFDYGKEGLFDTISYLDELGIPHVGAGRTSAEAYKPFVTCIRGTRIAIFGYYGGGEAPAATRTTGGVARRDIHRILQDIAEVRTEDSTTYVVISLHWGTEKAEAPDRQQQAFARALIDGGANAIIGHHPHVLQGIEEYHGGVIVYSLGNFIFGGNSRSTYDTGVFEIRLRGSAGPDYTFIPVGVREWQARVLDGEDARTVVKHVEQLSSQFPQSIFTSKE